MECDQKKVWVRSYVSLHKQKAFWRKFQKPTMTDLAILGPVAELQWAS